MLLDLNQDVAEVCWSSPNPGKILRNLMLNFSALVVKIGVDTADMLIL